MIATTKKLFYTYRYSADDQENVKKLIEQWQQEKPDDSFAMQVKTAQSPLLFLHQTANQRHLLSRYGQEMCMMDATYKTCKYSTCLFFIVVKTNCDYQVKNAFASQVA